MFTKPKRQVSKVFIHCTAADINAAGEELKSLVHRWHVIERGWSDIGYHYLIDKNGLVIPCRPLEKVPAAQRGHNIGSIAICVHGLTDFTGESMESLIKLCEEIDEVYDHQITFHGHREVNPHKTCPVFPYSTVLRLDEKGYMQ